LSDQVPEAPAPEPVTSGGWTFSNSDGNLVFSLTWDGTTVDVKLGKGMSYTKAAEMFFDRLRGLKA
jgi:hypothetical protein